MTIITESSKRLPENIDACCWCKLRCQDFLENENTVFLWSNRIHAFAHISDVADRIESDNGLFAPELEKTAFLEGVARTAQSFFENDDFFITKNYEFSKKTMEATFFFGGSRTMRLVPQNASSRNRQATCATSCCESATDALGLGTNGDFFATGAVVTHCTTA